MKTIQLRNGSVINLVEVEREDTVIIGTTNSGKRFVCASSEVAEPLPAVHPYRVYLHGGEVLRVVDPPFAAMEQAYIDAPTGTEAGLRLADGSFRTITRGEVLSLLSATPEDQARAEAGANGHRDEADHEAHEVPDEEIVDAEVHEG